MRLPPPLPCAAVGLLAWAAAAACMAQPAQPVLQGLAATGPSGAGLTPSATPLAQGSVLLGYGTALPGQFGAERGHDIGLAVGLLPGLELSGRLATNDLNCNLFGLGANPCSRPVQRDLSASFKLGHRFSLPAWPGWGLAAAVGATDLGGAATNYRSYYGALGLDHGPWAVTAGWAQKVSAAAPLDGLFASLQWRAADWAQLQAERIGGRHWLGAKLLLPEAWRPAGIQPWLGLQHSLQQDGFSPRQWWTAGVAISLGHPGSAAQRPATAAPPLAWPMALFSAAPAPAGDASLVAAASPPAAASPSAAADPPPRAAQVRVVPLPAAAALPPAAWAAGLAARLAAAGFEDVSVGQRDGVVVVDAENSGYQWNDLDALGVALGLVSAGGTAGNTADNAPGPLDLRLRKRGIVVWRALGSAGCIAAWLREAVDLAEACAGRAGPQLLAGALARPGAETVAWWVQDVRNSLGRPRLLLAPDIDSRVGTEYGTFDTSVGLNLALQLPLWRGAHADVAYVQALGHSADYAPGGVFADFRIDSQLYRVMLHQALDLGSGLEGLAGRVAVGRLFKQLDGGLVELRWMPGDGRHRLGLELARFEHRSVDFKKQSAMASYRWFAAPLQTALELQGGRFWHGDRGAMGVLRHWFGDTSVALTLRRSRFDADAPLLYSPYGSRFVNAAGIEFSFPLTPRREHVGTLFQLRGAERFSYGVQSVVGQSSSNHLTPWFGRFAPVPMGLAGSVDNSDRASQAYLDSNLPRVREAWRSLPPPTP